MTRGCGCLPVIATALGMVLIAVIAGCSSGAPVVNPATVAQVKARLLGPGQAPGFVPEPRNLESATRSATAQPFTPPRGSTDHACAQFMAMMLIAPAGLLSTGQSIGVLHPQKYGPLAPSWIEWIDVYPGTEAASIVKALPALIGRCRHFTLENTAAGAGRFPAREAVAPLPGLGDQALYVTVRVGSARGRYLANDWVVIRSDRTLIWIDDQASVAVGSGPDPLTLRLAEDAWRHFSAA